jgi:hypothetical protein
LINRDIFRAWSRVWLSTPALLRRLKQSPGSGSLAEVPVLADIENTMVIPGPLSFVGIAGARIIDLVTADAAERQDSTGGKQKLGPISKQGDRYLRRILVVGAHSVLRRAKQNPEKYPWLTQLLARRPFKVVAIALANKMARIAWALLARGGTYRVPALAAA